MFKSQGARLESGPVRMLGLKDGGLLNHFLSLGSREMHHSS